MKTTFNALKELFIVLNTGTLKNAITGGIYINQRPDGSIKEDVVINSLPISDGTVQRATLNVNIHVSDLQIQIDGQAQQMPDIFRMETLANLAITKVREIFTPNWSLYVSSQRMEKSDITNQHYVNIRLEYITYNP